ncbi:hypothetical protein V8G54_016476 [Vigna mungo]|uniref:Uncharacterized protein n=1 Tax=Vigna mungo TaxID=3915 RepID=A0AAQ3NN65_VIGMU
MYFIFVLNESLTVNGTAVKIWRTTKFEFDGAAVRYAVDAGRYAIGLECMTSVLSALPIAITNRRWIYVCVRVLCLVVCKRKRRSVMELVSLRNLCLFVKFVLLR